MTYLAVFDWNCTLFDDFDPMLDGTNASISLFGRPAVDAEALRDHFTMPILHGYVALGIGVDEYLSRHEEAALTFLECYEKGALDCYLKDGAMDLLSWLNEQNVHCLLLSNHLRENIDIQLRRFQIENMFDSVSGRDQYDASFISGMDKQDRLELYMKENGFTPDKAFIIGDSEEEPEIGNHLGLTTFSITGGVVSEERLKKCEPDYIVHDLPSVKVALEELWNLSS